MFSAIKKNRLKPGLAAVGVGPTGVCLVQVVRQAGRPPRIQAHVYRPLEAGESLNQVLEAMAREHGLLRMQCTTVLNDNDYKLLLTETPEVPPDELKSAVRWRIKDLIDFHINDTILDLFDIPGEDGAKANRELYVVAARSQAIQERVDLLVNAGMHLDIIDIPELAQRNIAALLPEDAQGVALLSFNERGGLITLTRQGLLYLSRSLGTTPRNLEDESSRMMHFEQVVLEVQRSLDYYESHFRQAPIRTLVLAPLPFNAAALMEFLGANLNVSVQLLHLAQYLDAPEDLPPTLQGTCLSVLGAALRQEALAP